MDYKMLNGADLAYIGDAVYEVKIRLYLLNKNITKTKELNQMSTQFVSAKAHAVIYEKIKDEFTDEEKAVFLRGRNKAPYGHRKNVNRGEYQISSGYEAVIGYLYLKKDYERVDYLVEKSINIIEESLC